MEKPKEIQELEEHYGIELKKVRLERVMDWKNRNSFALDDKSTIIGLNLWGNKIEDLKPIQNLNNLQTLNLSYTKIKDLKPIQNLNNLQTLYLSSNKIKDLKPIQNLNNLQNLFLSSNKIEDLKPIQNLNNLQTLFLSSNKIEDLKPIQNFNNLQNLDLSGNQIQKIDLTFLNTLKALTELYLSDNPIQNLPKEIFDKTKNVLSPVRHYLEDLEKSSHPNREVKLVFIGNGSVGKTQIARRLALGKDFIFDEQHKSTHGIEQLPCQLETADSEINTLYLKLWDFAGQDIYHATHRLFMQTKAVFVLVWDAENEQKEDHTFQGKPYKNEKLRYWLEYAKCFGKGSPILLVQNKIDRLEDQSQKLLKELEAEYRTQYPISDIIRLSAKSGKGFTLLKESIINTFIQDADLRQQLLIDLPTAWVNVRTALRNQRTDGAKELSWKKFESVCESFEVQKSAKTIVQFLHDTGVLYYRHNYFNNRIILDQAWAIHAIYQILDRSSHYYEVLEHHQGQLNYTRLCKIWPKYTDEERTLFIDFMLSCELCFETTEDKKYGTPLSERTFTVPQLLPPACPEQVGFQLQRRPLLEEYILIFRFLPKVFIQRFIVQAYRLAEPQHMWQSGILLSNGQGRALVTANYQASQIHILYNPEAVLLRDKIIEKLKKIEDEGQVKPDQPLQDVDWEQENALFWSGQWQKTTILKPQLNFQMDQPVLLLSFAANDLAGVQSETQKVWDSVSSHLEINALKLENASIPDLADAVIDNDEQLFMFHFGGHADQQGIVLNGFRDLDKVRLSRLLLPRENHHLQLVFLNGCLSYGHVGLLTAKGVKAIIATNVNVGDQEAVSMASYFYKLFFEKAYTLKESFETAEATVRGKNSYITIVNPGEIDDQQAQLSSWTLFVNGKHKEILDWKLSDFIAAHSGKSGSDSFKSSSILPNPDLPKIDKNTIRQKITNNHISEALKLMSQLADDSFSNEIVHLQARLNNLNRQERLGIINYSQASISKNQITMAVLNLLESI
ncbi:MAG: leucine-rich repeat domain-containing protein [Chitinophagales bacterium]|nr:leucine-rich repeat domain-containing protein [Chitinophagales bacterium]